MVPTQSKRLVLVDVVVVDPGCACILRRILQSHSASTSFPLPLGPPLSLPLLFSFPPTLPLSFSFRLSLGYSWTVLVGLYSCACLRA